MITIYGFLIMLGRYTIFISVFVCRFFFLHIYRGIDTFTSNIPLCIESIVVVSISTTETIEIKVKGFANLFIMFSLFLKFNCYRILWGGKTHLHVNIIFCWICLPFENNWKKKKRTENDFWLSNYFDLGTKRNKRTQ